jgi:hypothetical protein
MVLQMEEIETTAVECLPPVHLCMVVVIAFIYFSISQKLKLGTI